MYGDPRSLLPSDGQGPIEAAGHAFDQPHPNRPNPRLARQANSVVLNVEQHVLSQAVKAHLDRAAARPETHA